MLNEKQINNLTGLVLSVSFVFWCLCLSAKFFTFGYFDWDLAIITQALWMLGRGSQYFSLGDYNFFGDHANYIALLFVPLVKIFPHPLTLLAVKVIAFHAAALSFYVIAKKFVEAPVASLMTLTFLIFPPNVLSMLYEFNFDIIGMALLMWMIYGFVVESYSLFLGTAVFGLLVKENMYLVFMMFGVMGLCLAKRNKIKWGLVPIIAGAVLFYAVMFHLLPSYRGLDSSAFVFRYQHLGGSTGEIFNYILSHPIKVLKIMFSPYNLNFLQELFGANLVLSVFSPQILLLSAPLFLQHLLSLSEAEHVITSHYSHLLVPFIFLSAVYSIHYLEPRLKKYYAPIGISAALVVLILTGYHLFQYRVRLVKQYAGRTPEIARKKWELVNQIPKDAAVITMLEYTAPLSPRKYLYSFHKIYDDRFQSDDKKVNDSFYKEDKFQLPPQVEYALIDFDSFFLAFQMATNAVAIIPRIEAFFRSDAWLVVANDDHHVLFRRLPPAEAARLGPQDYIQRSVFYPTEDGSEVTMNIRVVK